jgi:putative membrane protein
MGILWFLLSYSATATLKWLKNLTGFFRRRISRAFAGALLMVMLDYWLEPAASNMDFWEWENGTGIYGWLDSYYPAPYLNFLTWFVFSGLLVWLCDFFTEGQQPNKPALWVLPVQGLFFFLMSLA